MEALHDCITSLIRDIDVLRAWFGGLSFWKFEFEFEISAASLFTKHDPSGLCKDERSVFPSDGHIFWRNLYYKFKKFFFLQKLNTQAVFKL
jgi:hypothetical protein